MKERFTDEQIISLLRQAAAGTPIKGAVPQARFQRCLLLPVPPQVRRLGCARRQAAQGAAGGERKAQEDAGRGMLDNEALKVVARGKF